MAIYVGQTRLLCLSNRVGHFTRTTVGCTAFVSTYCMILLY